MAHTVLVVDDAMDMRIYLKSLFKGQGVCVEVARDGSEALARVRKGGVSLIVLDIMMPGEGGVLMYRRLKMEPELSQIPVIMHSAISERMFTHYLRLEEGLGEALAPPLAYFEKPAEPGRLKAALAKGLQLC